MSSFRLALRGIRARRRDLHREIAIRDEVIELLCYRHVIFNQKDAGHRRAQLFADGYVDRARNGSLRNDRDLLPPNVRLWQALYTAYYAVPGRYSMTTHPPATPLPEGVVLTAQEAARLVERYWREMPGFKQWLEQQYPPALPTRTGRRGRVGS